MNKGFSNNVSVDASTKRVDKTDGQNVENQKVYHIIAHSFNHTASTDGCRLYYNKIIFIWERDISILLRMGTFLNCFDTTILCF
jgi:hypothetical protein